MDSNKKFPWHAIPFGLLVILIVMPGTHFLFSALANSLGEGSFLYGYLVDDLSRGAAGDRYSKKGSFTFMLSIAITVGIIALYVKKFPYKEGKSMNKWQTGLLVLVSIFFIITPIYLIFKESEISLFSEPTLDKFIVDKEFSNGCLGGGDGDPFKRWGIICDIRQRLPVR